MEYSIKEIIKKRKSIRTYNEEYIQKQDYIKLEEYIKTIDNPYHIPVEFKIVDALKYGLSSPVIVGEKQYIIGKVKNVKHGEEAFGYAFEKLILYATSLGLGTVWIAGTMNRSVFEKAIDLADDEIMASVTPIGYPATKISLRESMMRKGIKADERLPFETLFFNESFKQSLSKEKANRYEDALEMVRLAPSAVNRQPWRIVVCENVVHFYKNNAKKDSWDIQKIDIGIAMAHFELTLNQEGIKGQFIIEDPKLIDKEEMEYIISYKIYE